MLESAISIRLSVRLSASLEKEGFKIVPLEGIKPQALSRQLCPLYDYYSWAAF